MFLDILAMATLGICGISLILFVGAIVRDHLEEFKFFLYGVALALVAVGIFWAFLWSLQRLFTT